MEKHYTKRIEAYLKCMLSEDEKKQFEQDLKHNPALKKVFNENKLAMDVIDVQTEIDLRNKMAGWRKESKNNVRRIALLLSSAAVIILFVGIYFLTTKTYTTEQLAFKYYQLPEAPGKTMGDENINRINGLEAYRNKSFQKTINEWELISNPDPEINYYLAHCYFNVKNYQKAASVFKKLSEESSVYNYPSDWFLVLAYMAMNNMEQFNKKAKMILEDKNHPYHLEVKELVVKTKIIKND